MLDIGWPELLVVAIILIVVVGPKDLPPMLRAFGKMTTRLRKTAGEFRSQFDDALREAELDDVRTTISDARKLNPMNSVREALNPLRQAGNEIKSDLQKAVKAEPLKGPVENTQESEAAAPDEKVSVEPAVDEKPTPVKTPKKTPPKKTAAKTASKPATKKPAAAKSASATKKAAPKTAAAKPAAPLKTAATSKTAGTKKAASVAKSAPARKAPAKKAAAPKKTGDA